MESSSRRETQRLSVERPEVTRAHVAWYGARYDTSQRKRKTHGRKSGETDSQRETS